MSTLLQPSAKGLWYKGLGGRLPCTFSLMLQQDTLNVTAWYCYRRSGRKLGASWPPGYEITFPRGTGGKQWRPGLQVHGEITRWPPPCRVCVRRQVSLSLSSNELDTRPLSWRQWSHVGSRTRHSSPCRSGHFSEGLARSQKHIPPPYPLPSSNEEPPQVSLDVQWGIQNSTVTWQQQVAFPCNPKCTCTKQQSCKILKQRLVELRGKNKQTHSYGWGRQRSMCSVTQSCLTLCDSIECSLPASSVHGISQARILKWVYPHSTIKRKIRQKISKGISSVQFSHSVVSSSLRPHESQHTRPPCPSPTPGIHPNSCPSSQWCHPAISSSVVPFSSCPQSLPASESFPESHMLRER